MNASSLKVNLGNLKENGIIIANKDGFDDKNLKLAGYSENPLEDKTLEKFQVFAIDMYDEIKKELSDLNTAPKIVKRTKNIFALGITYWMFNRPIEPTVDWINKKFRGKEDIVLANIRVLNAGWNFARKNPAFTKQYKIEKSKLGPGKYRNITGNQAVALGLVVASRKADLPLFLGSYPITPLRRSFRRYQDIKNMAYAICRPKMKLQGSQVPLVQHLVEALQPPPPVDLGYP
jgi:2-oxoglutarate/2-oxoacid ferredoxin oxidoreductase subunit alpha